MPMSLDHGARGSGGAGGTLAGTFNRPARLANGGGDGRRSGGRVRPSSTQPAQGEDHQIVSRSRAHVRQRLTELGLERRTDDAEIVVSELVTNAILHGGGCEGVAVQPVEGGVRIEVSDRRPVAPVLGMRGAEGMTGRGLRMVAGIASHWGVELTDPGKVVWAQLTDEAPIAQAYSEGDLVAMWGD